MKKAIVAAAGVVLSGMLALSLTACDLLTNGGSTENVRYPSEVAGGTGGQGSAESWLASQGTPSTYERRLYEELRATGEIAADMTYAEFLAAYGLTSEDDTASIGLASHSVVALTVTFTVGSQKVVSQGSGVIYQLDKNAGTASIVTNYHVVATALSTGSFFNPVTVTTDWTSIVVTLYGGENITSSQGDGVVSYQAGGNNVTVEGVAVGTDLAVLQVESDVLSESGAVAAKAASSVAVGEEAYAIGNAEGDGISVTRGVVSTLDESISITGADNRTPVLFDAMRTDAAINHGNSGGGLFNERGELIGIATARREQTPSGIDVDGFGYAIPVAQVNEALTALSCPGLTVLPAAETTADGANRSLLNRTEVSQRMLSGVVVVVGDLGEGTGVVYDLDESKGNAYIVTNYHVIYSSRTSSGVSRSITLYLSEDRDRKQAIPATFVGGAMAEDVAVLKVENCDAVREGKLTEVIAADSDSLTVAEDVYVVGNAAGYGISTAAGIVSVLDETIHVAASDDKTILTLNGIRTDAAVNHGNSGGAMFNEMGELVGIVSARSDEEGVVAFGYAIPSNRAMSIAQSVIDNSPYTTHAVRAYLGGIRVNTSQTHTVYDPVTGKNYTESSVTVYNVPSTGTASELGLDVGDVLVGMKVERNGKLLRSVAITREHMVNDVLYGIRKGDTLTLTVARGSALSEHSYTFSSNTDFIEIV